MMGAMAIEGMAVRRAVRVRKEDVKIERVVPQDGLSICLDFWSTWMGQSDSDSGIQGQRTLRGDGDGYGNEDTSRMRHANEIAEATDAMIDGLSMVHRWAIYKSRGLATAWRFPNADYMHTAQAAQAALIVKLKINVATGRYFQ
jgi:hypothetical protein